MSSMFKKKGGLAFKPKIPVTRPRPTPAAATPKAVDDPVTTDVSPNEPAQRPRRGSEALGQSSVSESPFQTAEIVIAESSSQSTAPETPAINDTPAGKTARRLSTGLSHTEKESATPVNQVVVDPSLEEASASGLATPAASQPEAEPVALLASATSETEPSVPDRTLPQREHEEASQSPSGQDDVAIATPPASGKTAPAARPRAKRQASAPTTSNDGTENPKPKKRQRKAATEDVDDSQPRPRQRRNNSDNPPRSRRARSLTPEDAENQVVDLQKLKMSDLTKDLHIGKKFSRHDELRERERQAKLKAKLGKDSTQSDKEDSTGPEGIRAKSGTPTNTTESGAAPAAGPQFRIVDGQIIVDQSSLVMDRHARAAAARAGEDIETIEENDFTRLITSSSFMNTSKLKGPNIWTDEETELFYRALRMFGTDFEIISKMFPHKQRRHIKLKFNREERHCPRRIDAALVGQKTIRMDIDEYKAATGSEFEPVEDIEAEQRKIAEDFEAERKRVADEQEEMMRKKREELFAEDDEASNKKKKGKKKGKQAVAYGLNGEPIQTEA